MVMRRVQYVTDLSWVDGMEGVFYVDDKGIGGGGGGVLKQDH